MHYSLTWLPTVLLNADLKVAMVDGWESRGHGDMGTIEGVICHHTAGPRIGNFPSLGIVRDGRSDLPGPLAQLGLGRDGTWYVIAAGRCNHAGPGAFNNLTAGNTHFIGIEAENTGLHNDFPWPDVQLDSYRRGVAAILKHVNKNSDCCIGHREWALPQGRKTDPTFDMDGFRYGVNAIIGGNALMPHVIPVVEAGVNGQPGRATIRRGAANDLVKTVQRKLKVDVTGSFDGHTEAAVRTFQRERGMVPDGIVGPKTWAALDGVK